MNPQQIQEKQQARVQLPWDSISEPGAYVEVGTGKLFRIPQEALLEGSSPVIRQSGEPATYVQLSKNPHITLSEARMRAAENNVQPTF